MKTNLIGIHTLSVSTELSDFVNRGIYCTVPMVLYKVNHEKVKYFLVNRPIEIFHENMDYSILRNIVRGEDKDISFLSIPGKSYNKMQKYANQNVNKVIADMITYIVVKCIRELKEEDSSSKNIFFIDSIDTNKIIGRLGYLYLDSKVNTISFVTYKAGGLLTDVLNGGHEKLAFDINYFKRQERDEKQFSEIIPNDFMESLVQTVFFQLPFGEKELAPLRFDILSQGLSKQETQNKVNDIRDILNCKDNVSLPYLLNGTNSTNISYVAIPWVLKECIDATEQYKHIAQLLLEETLYE